MMIYHVDIQLFAARSLGKESGFANVGEYMERVESIVTISGLSHRYCFSWCNQII